MAHTVESRVSNPAARLRDDLARAERMVVSVTPQNVEELLALLDSIEAQLTALEQDAMDMRPELGRWEGLLRRVQRRPNSIVAAARRTGGMAAMRTRHAPAAGFWWHLDELQASRRRRTLMQSIAVVGGVIGTLILAYWLINTLFPPDPAAVFMVETNARLEQPLLEQDWDGALAILESAQQTLPDEAELYIWEAVVAAQTGDSNRSTAAAARARTLMADDEVRYLVVTANHQMRIGDVAGAEASIADALAMDADSPQAHFILAEIAEARGDFSRAVELFDQTYELALDHDNQLAAMARIRMAGAIQRIGQPPVTTPATP